MYKIIGADGREYGPVTVEQVHQWIREGRANPQTKVQAEGGTEWKALGELPEFSASFSGGGAMPPANPVTLAAEISARAHEIDIASCISRGWNLVKNNFWPLLGTSLLVFLLIGGVGGVLRSIVNTFMGTSMRLHEVHGVWDVLCVQWPGILVNTSWNLFVTGALLGGLYNYYLKLIRGQPATIGDAFAGLSSALIPLTIAHIVVGILSSIGCLFCLVPGIYLGVAWKFTLPLVIDKRLGFWEAMELSRKMVNRQWWSVFALLLLAGLISFSGVILCCIGVFITAPIGIAATLYAYEDIFGVQPPPKILEPSSDGRRGRQAAWSFVLGNLVLPGFGTFAAGRRVEGALQLVFSQGGFVLMVVWAVLFVRTWLRLGNLPEDMGPHGGLCFLGLALFFLAWIWSLASSYGILQDSRTRGL